MSKGFTGQPRSAFCEQGTGKSRGCLWNGPNTAMPGSMARPIAKKAQCTPSDCCVCSSLRKLGFECTCARRSGRVSRPQGSGQSAPPAGDGMTRASTRARQHPRRAAPFMQSSQVDQSTDPSIDRLGARHAIGLPEDGLSSGQSISSWMATSVGVSSRIRARARRLESLVVLVLLSPARRFLSLADIEVGDGDPGPLPFAEEFPHELGGVAVVGRFHRIFVGSALPRAATGGPSRRTPEGRGLASGSMSACVGTGSTGGSLQRWRANRTNIEAAWRIDLGHAQTIGRVRAVGEGALTAVGRVYFHSSRACTSAVSCRSRRTRESVSASAITTVPTIRPSARFTSFWRARS